MKIYGNILPTAATADKWNLINNSKVFDTVAISGNFMYLPDIDLLIANGCKVFFSKNGEVYKVVLNGKPGAKEPRLTITKSQKGFWRLQAEVSIGAWLFNSNLFLPNEDDLKQFFSDLSDFIFYKIGIRFNVCIERATILDVTRDCYTSESGVLSVLKDLSNIEIPKYNRRPFNDTSVYWENKGKIKNKIFKVYSKQHDFIEKGASIDEIELAKGVLRLEIHYGDSRAVSNLGKSLKLPNYRAGQIMTRQTSERVIDDAMKLLSLDSLLNNQSSSKLETLALNNNSSMPLTLAGHLLFKAEYGAEYYKLPFINLSADTVKKYERECAKTGTLSL
jgi:hypothetical protein